MQQLSPLHHCVRLSALLLASACARAGEADGGGPEWTFGGFGSAGVVHASGRDADYSASVVNPGRAGHSRRWSADVDSRLGAQLGVQLDKRWEAVVQLVAERSLDHSYAPVLEWANIQYQATPELSLRVGRIALPAFLATDYRKASYALPWVRPPVELYAAIPISNSDGVDASYRWQAGAFKHVTQASYGRSSVQADGVTLARARRLAGLSHTATVGALSVRAGVLHARLTADVAPMLFAGLRRYGVPGMALAGRYEAQDKRVTVASVGFNYDPGGHFVLGEAGRVNTRSFFGDKSAAYLSAGWRHGALTPYALHARVRANSPTRVAGLDAPAAASMNGALNGLLASVAVQDSSGAGLRWDFLPAAAFKLQYDRVRPRDGSSGTLINVQPGFRSGQAIGVASAMVDFVF